jgi:23S rRNA pseudouridine1911/1915/1917 synthase
MITSLPDDPSNPEMRSTVVPDNLSGERLDRALSALFPGRSRSNLARLVDLGHVRIAGRTATKPSERVESGQTIDITFPPPAPSGVKSQNLPLKILYEDDDIAIIDKPPGLVVHPAAGHPDETLVNALLFHVGGLSGVGGEIRPGIIHRLDKDTSGVMIIAKHDAAHRALTEAWGTPAVRKEYLALVYGSPVHASGTIDAPIGRDPRDRKRMAVVPRGRQAMTDYVVLEKHRHVSLLRCVLRTGRTHQIRVHLKHLGHPIVGDPVYGGPQWRGIPDKKLQKVLSSMERQALHAAKLTFPHPTTGVSMSFESEMPEDMRALLASLS